MRVTTTNWKKISTLIIVGAVFALLNQVEAASQSDAIAVRILPNVHHDNIETWYTNQGYKGSPQSLIVDGYEAIRDGRTVFVNAANIDSGNWYKPLSLSDAALGRECKVKIAVDKITGAVNCNLDLFLNPNTYAEEFFGAISYGTGNTPYCSTSKCSTMVNANKCRWVEGGKEWSGQCSVRNNSTKIYTNVYLISYNQESEEKTLDILGQLVSHWKFNNNLTESGRCSISKLNCQTDSDCPKDYTCSNTKCQPSTIKACLIDSDCPLNLFCDSLKARVTRDVNRLGKLNQFGKAIENFKQANGTYPSLQFGTYILGSSLSVWPSWKETLTPQLGLGQTLLDPINSLGFCSGHDPVTCWNDKTKSFVNSNLSLPAGSYAFNYTATKNGVNYSLCSVFETGLLGYDTADEKISTHMCSVNNSAGYNSNTAPYVESSYTGGESGKEFNGYVKIKDAEGDLVSWSLNALSTAPWISGDWRYGNSLIPVLQDTGDPNQKRIYAPKAGKPGLYDMNLVLTDSRGAATTTKLTLNISEAGKPRIEAEDITYFVDPIIPLKYSFIVEGSNSKPSFKVTSSNSNFSSLIKEAVAKATETSVGLNKSKIDFSFRIPDSVEIKQDVVIPLLITATADNITSSVMVNITIKMEKPLLDFQCDTTARLGASYPISGNSCFLGKQKSGNYNLSYSVSSINNLYVDKSSSAEDVYLKADTIKGSIATSSIVKITVANEYGSLTEKSFALKVNTFCGDGVKQIPNSEGQGGLYNNGMESCDGADGVWASTTAVSTNPAIQYACTTGLNVKSPYPILNSNSCVFKSAVEGGGYCGDGYCQNKIINPQGSLVEMETCKNCSSDCGACVCVPSCEVNICGDDGCGGSCGDCSEDEECVNGSCCLSGADVQVSADNKHLTYFNEVEVASGHDWTKIQKFNVTLQKGVNVFAIQADDDPGASNNLHGLSATLNVYGCKNKTGSKTFSMNTDSTNNWRCTEEKNYINLTGWNLNDYNDDAWPTAQSLGNKGPVRGNSLPYNQIWAANETSGVEDAKTIYCRYSFSTAEIFK